MLQRNNHQCQSIPTFPDVFVDKKEGQKTQRLTVCMHFQILGLTAKPTGEGGENLA